MHRLSALIRRLVGVVGVLVVLTAAAPDLAVLRAGLADIDRWVQRDGVDLVLAQLVGTVAWIAALWLVLGFGLVAGSRLPGAAGRASATLALRALPAGVRRTAALALGAGLVTSTVSSTVTAPIAGTVTSTVTAPDAGTVATRATVPVTDSGGAAHSVEDRSTVDFPDRTVIHARSASTVDWPVNLADDAGDVRGVQKATTADSSNGEKGVSRPASTVDRPADDGGAVHDIQAASTVDSLGGDDGLARPASTVDWPIDGVDAVHGVQNTSTVSLLGDDEGIARPASMVDWPVNGADAAHGVQGMSTVDLPDGRVDPARSKSAVDWPVDLTDGGCAVQGRQDTSTADSPDGEVDPARPASTVDWPVGEIPDVAAVDGVHAGSSVERSAGDRRSARSASPVDWPVASAAERPVETASTVDWPIEEPDSRSAAPPVRPDDLVRRVVVEPGDTLWSIASRRLGPGAKAPAIAAEWRRWHAANRELIGADPRRLRAGVSLRVPGTA